MRTLIIVSILLSCQLLVNAQWDHPLVINIDGQIYTWKPGFIDPSPSGCNLQGERLHNWDSSLVASPDGVWVTFMTLEEDAQPTAPADTGKLWVCNISERRAYMLSEISETRMVSKGAFSPDSSQIVWTEVAGDFTNPASARLMLHDFLSQETRISVESLPLAVYCSVTSGAPSVIWGDQGIAIPYALTETSEPCSTVTEHGFAHYAADGTLLNRFPVGNTFFNTFLWLAGDENRLAYYGFREERSETQLYTINMNTGAIREENAVIEAFLPSGNTSRYHITELEYGFSPPMIYPPDSGAAIETQADVAISPNAGIMIIVLGQSLYIADGAHFYPVLWNRNYYVPYVFAEQFDEYNASDYSTAGQLEIAWASPQYRLVWKPHTVCPTVEELDLSFGAQVVEGEGENNLRTAPSRTATVLGRIPELGVVNPFPSLSPYTSLPNSVCSEGIRWRQVVYEGLVGWTAEAQEDSYYLQTSGG